MSTNLSTFEGVAAALRQTESAVYHLKAIITSDDGAGPGGVCACCGGERAWEDGDETYFDIRLQDALRLSAVRALLVYEDDATPDEIKRAARAALSAVIDEADRLRAYARHRGFMAPTSSKEVQA